MLKSALTWWNLTCEAEMSPGRRQPTTNEPSSRTASDPARSLAGMTCVALSASVSASYSFTWRRLLGPQATMLPFDVGQTAT